MKQFNETLKALDPDGGLSRFEVDLIRKFYNKGYEHALDGDTSNDAAEMLRDVKALIEYFNEKTGKRMGVSAGHTKTLIARFKAGYTLETLKDVIDYAVSEWSDHHVYSKHIKLNVLFGSNIKVDKYRDNWMDIKSQKSSEQLFRKDDNYQSPF